MARRNKKRSFGASRRHPITGEAFCDARKASKLMNQAYEALRDVEGSRGAAEDAQRHLSEAYSALKRMGCRTYRY